MYVENSPAARKGFCRYSLQNDIAAPQFILSNWSTQPSFSHFLHLGNYGKTEKSRGGERTVLIVAHCCPHFHAGPDPFVFSDSQPKKKKKRPTYEMSRMGGMDAGVHEIS